MPDGAVTLDDIREELKRREKDAASLSDVQAELKRRQAKEHAAAPEKRSISGARPITPPAVPQRAVTPQRQQMQAKSSGDRFASTIGPAHPQAQPNLLQRIGEGFGAVLGYPKGLLAAAALPAHEALHSARGSAVKPTPAEKARDDANVKRLMRQNIFQRALSLEGQNPADPTLGRPAQQSQNARASRAQFHQGDVLMKFLGDVETDPLTYLIGPANELLPPPARAALTASFATSMATSGAQKIHQGFTQHDPDLAFEGSLDLAMGAAAGKAAHGEAVDVRNTAARTGLIADHLVDRRGDISREFVDRLAKRYHVDPVKLARAYEKKATYKAIPDHNGPAEVNARSEKIAAATEAARRRAVPPKPIITEKAKEALRKKGEGETRTPAETKKVPPSATNTGGVDPTLSRRTEPVTEYPQTTTNDPVMDRIRQQAAQEHKAKMDAIAGDRRVLHARLRDAVTILNDAGRRTLGKGVLDFENKRLVSDDGTWALQWEPSQTTRGSVHMIRLKGIQDGLPRPLPPESPVGAVTKPKQKGEAVAVKQITARDANKQMGERTNREAQGGDAGEYISAHSVTKASKPYRDPEVLQGLIDSREDELVSQGVSLAGLADSSPQGRALIGHTVQGITYEAMPKDLDELYRERDRGYADQNYQAVEQAMGRVSKESKAGRITEDDIRKAVEESVQKHSLADAMQHPPSNIEQVFSNFYNNLAWERATADHSFPHAWVSLDHVLDVIRGGWKNSHYGSSPEPFVRQAASIFKDILGQAPDIEGLPAPLPKAPAGAPHRDAALLSSAGRAEGLLSGKPKVIDDIAKEMGLSAGEAGVLLTFMELDGKVRRLPGNNYILTKPVETPKSETKPTATPPRTPRPPKVPAGAPEAGTVHIKPDEAADIALHLGDHPLADAMERSATKGKAHPLTAEQVAELRGLLDKRSVPKGAMPTIFPEVVKPKAKATPAREMSDKSAGVAITKALAEKEGKPRKPLGGAPPPDAPIVGGAPTVSGGSGRPSGFRLPVFERPTGTGLRSRWNEFTRRVSNWLNRGSAGIERHAIATGDPSLLRAQRKEAGSTQQVNIMRSHTMPLIRKAFGGSDAKTEQFFHYLAEGSLRGARQRWSDYHAQVLALPGPSVADPNILPKYLNALEQLEGRRRDHAALDDARDPETETSDDRIVDPADPRADRSHFAPGLVRRAENLASNGAYDELRILLANTFNQAHASVGVMADFDPGRAGRGAEDFDAYGEKTQVTAAMKHYKEGIGDPISRAYKANRGAASAAVGPLDTYFPLVPFREEGAAARTAAPKAAFSNVPTAGAKFKTGLSERYDTSKDTVLQAIGHQIRTNNRGALVNSLRDIGLAKDIPQGLRLTAGPQTIRIAGVDVPAVVRPWKESVKVVRDGKTYFTPGKNMLVAKFAADELQPQLEKGEYEPGALGKITQAYVFGPAAGLMHNWNLAANVVAGTPFVGKGLGKVPGSIPGLKMAASVTQGLSIDPMAPERAADLRELAEMGLLHPKTGTVTSSRAVAEQTGAKFRPDFSPMLYGMKGTEVRARLQLLDIARAVGEETGKEVTPEDKFNFISQAGIYANGLDSKIEQITKRAQAAPFITAGKNIIGTGTKALTGTTPLPRNLSRAAKANLRARQFVSSGLVGATGLWFAAFYAYTGRLPGKGDRFNQIPVKESDRNTWLGRKMFGKSPGQKYVSLDLANPALARGMHATGATALINGRMKGSDPDTIVAAMLKDQINGLGSPVFNAPAVRMASTALVGKEPYIVSWRGLKPNEVNPTFIDAVDQERMGVHRMAMQILNAALNSNSVTEIGGQITGIGHRREDRKGESGDTVALQTAWDLLFPRSVPFQVPQKQGGGGGKAERYDRVGAGSGMEQIR